MTVFRIALAAMAVAWSFNAQAANRPAGYITLCSEGKTCSVSSSTQVAFGRADKFFYKQLTGSFVCNEATFGGRVAGGTNECSVPKAGSSSSSVSSASSSSLSSSSSSSKSSSSSSSSSFPTGITGGTCVSTGSVTVNATIRVTGGVYDGGCKTFIPGPAFEVNENPPPVFRLENGATLRNVIMGAALYGDSVHVYGGGTVENATWVDVNDDALTVKTTGVVNVNGLTAGKSADRIFQVNAAGSVLNVSNCVIDTVGNAVVRQNGGTTYKITVAMDRCRIANAVRVFRADSPTSIATLSNSQLRNVTNVCFGTWKSCTESGNTTY
ncbi:MAG: pectate lyase [Rhodocyclaceae bacterium]